MLTSNSNDTAPVISAIYILHYIIYRIIIKQLIHICFLIITWDTVITLLVNGSTLYLVITYPTPLPGGKVCSFRMFSAIWFWCRVRSDWKYDNVKGDQTLSEKLTLPHPPTKGYICYMSSRSVLRNSVSYWIPSVVLACCWALVPHLKNTFNNYLPFFSIRAMWRFNEVMHKSTF